MRYNDYRHDPLSDGHPAAAVCARGDLAAKGAIPKGCYDTKVCVCGGGALACRHNEFVGLSAPPWLRGCALQEVVFKLLAVSLLSARCDICGRGAGAGALLYNSGSQCRTRLRNCVAGLTAAHKASYTISPFWSSPPPGYLAAAGHQLCPGQAAECRGGGRAHCPGAAALPVGPCFQRVCSPGHAQQVRLVGRGAHPCRC